MQFNSTALRTLSFSFLHLLYTSMLSLIEIIKCFRTNWLKRYYTTFTWFFWQLWIS